MKGEAQRVERVELRVESQPLCGCGLEPCRPGQRTGLKCHAKLMKEYRQGHPHIESRAPMQRMQVIWALIRTGTYPNATRMAAYLETSTKSIHRDLEFMRDRLLFDIRYDASRFGYFTVQGPTQCPFCQPGNDVLAQLVGMALRGGV